MYQFKAKDSKLMSYLVRLGNISNKISFGYLKQTGLSRYVYEFLVCFKIIDVLLMNEYLMNKNNMK